MTKLEKSLYIEMEKLNELGELFPDDFLWIKKIAEKYPCSVEHIRFLLTQFGCDQEKAETYIRVELATGRLRTKL